MAEIRWNRFDYDDRASTAPKHTDLVWIVEEFYTGGVALGYFANGRFYTWAGSDDCHVSWWAEITYPSAPEGRPA